MFEKSSLWPFAGAILDSRGKGGQIAKTIKTCKKMKKTREGFGKSCCWQFTKTILEARKKNIKSEKTGKKNWQFSGTILECSRGKRRTSSHNNKT